ncbi:MAG: hypothetical protein IJ328_01875 [Muribaculaceae bacterium]|nr:hypothetical protein [Muribaculaceae bacterium]
MTTDLHSTIERILSKSSVLVEKYHALEIDKANAEQEIIQLREEIAVLRKELEKLRQDNEYLRIARSIAPSYEQLAESRSIISQLVRDVDKCISQLT